jgi:polysaccharide pyruvyl transferase WcaK-like protein
VLNMGDVAMLQAAVGRVTDMWPDAEIQVLTTDPDRLARHCAGVRPLPAAGRYAWTAEAERPGPIRRALLRGLAAGRGAPLTARASFEIERRVRGIDGDGGAYLQALRGADLLMITGRGCMCDAFRGESLQLLSELKAATELGVPTAMVGQGMGPLTDLAVRARAAEVLPEVGLIVLREAQTAPALLDALGVPSERVVVTGDDALELAAPAGQGSGEGIGLNVRVAEYAGMGADAIEAVGSAATAVAARLGAPLVATPISVHPAQADARTFARLTGSGTTPPASTAEAIEAVARCRVVITGAYHASVFALAQGIPPIGIAASDYNRGKLSGVAAQFDYAMPVLDPGDPGFRERLDQAVEAAWTLSSQRRGELVEAARRQVRDGRAAYRRLADLLQAA